MPQFEYKVVPAPATGIKTKGSSTPEDRFAHALQVLMNDMARDGWEYLRAESLPSLERSGLTAKTTRYRNLLVFRREVITRAGALETPAAPAPDAQPRARPQTPDEDASNSPGAREMLRDNGVEELSEVADMTDSLRALAAARRGRPPED